MGRQPHVWEFHGHRVKRWRDDPKDITNEIAKFDIDRLELLPFKYRRVRRFSNYCLKSPINQFLRGQIGRDYDEVFSELTALIPRKYHNTVDISDYKMQSSFHPEATRWFLDKHYARNAYGFYVDLETRVLCYEPPLGYRKIQEIERAKPVYAPFSVSFFKVRYDYGQNYVFNQLLVYEDFENEAFKMRHCIRNYWHFCVDFINKTSIWSMSNGTDKVLTLELRNGRIIQVRGLLNRRATEEEQKVIVYWAEWMKMTIYECAF
jgi:PcfJ-like protein